MSVLETSEGPMVPQAGNCTRSNVAFGCDDSFITLVRKRVDQHFAGGKQRDDPRLYVKSAIIALWFIGSYAALLTVNYVPLQVLLCLSYALAAAAMGFNIFHDATHGTFSSHRGVNRSLSRLTCAMLGMGRYFWWYKHNVLHHRYTNIFEWDDDLETRGSLRLSPCQPWQPKFKNQHRWFYLMYCAATVEWLFVKDFVQYFTLRINPYRPIPAMSANEKWEFWICKAFYLAVFVVLPFVLLPASHVIVGFLIFHVILSLILTFVFNLAHGSDVVDFPALDATSSIDAAWAVHQLRTTVNFAMENRAVTWFVGGLNFQIEHHLFPNICHTHYKDISAVVRGAALEHGWPYHQHETYLGAIRSHVRVLRALGIEPSLKPALAAAE